MLDPTHATMMQISTKPPCDDAPPVLDVCGKRQNNHPV
jgi:hypothetical protein